MFHPSLHTSSNAVPRRDALECLMRYGSKLKWGENDKIIDLGCGEGSVTEHILKRFVPRDCKVVGCDLSESMVAYANEEYGDARTYFMVQDVGGELKEGLRNSFNHVFSCYALHWIQDQERVFLNIYNLLTEGGDCLLLLVGRAIVFNFYRILMKQPKWQHYLRDAEKYISPYHDLEDPTKRIRGIMAQIGFKDIFVIYEEKSCVYDEDYFRKTTESICPFNIPADMKEQYWEDTLEAARELGAAKDVNGRTIITLQNSVITVSGAKE